MGRIGQKTPVPTDRHFGTSEEINNRDKVAHQMPETPFKQIGPDDQSVNADHMNEGAPHYNTDMKFGKI